MSNTASISRQRDKFQIEEVIVCPQCSKELECITSITNTDYYYCNTCNYNKNLVFKNVELDCVLNDIKNTFLTIESVDEGINLFIEKCSDKIALYINNTYINSRQFSNEFTNKDKKQLGYIVNDLIEDIFGEGKVKTCIEYKYKLSK